MYVWLLVLVQAEAGFIVLTHLDTMCVCTILYLPFVCSKYLYVIVMRHSSYQSFTGCLSEEYDDFFKFGLTIQTSVTDGV